MFDGEWNDGERVNGTLVLKDDYVYKGSFLKNIPHGHGEAI